MTYRLRLLLLASAALTAIPGLALAQDRPTGPVRVVVPFDAGSTPDVVARVVVEILGEAAVRDKLRAQYMDPVGNSTAEFRALLASDAARWKPIIQKHNISLD